MYFGECLHLKNILKMGSEVVLSKTGIALLFVIGAIFLYIFFAFAIIFAGDLENEIMDRIDDIKERRDADGKHKRN